MFGVPDTVRLGFEESQTPLTSGSQLARVWTEGWVAREAYCINCGHAQLSKATNNSPVLDFVCPVCADQFEVKAQKKPFGRKVADGAYFTKIERLKSSTIPNLMLVNYDLEQRQVRSVAVVPRHFFVPEIIEQRPPLAPTARRAGWIGSNILLGRVPEAGRIVVLRDGVPVPKEIVLGRWKQTLFLRRAGIEARGWLLEVMKAVDLIGRSEFDLDDVYAHEARLSATYPNNNNVRPKVRQQLQVLRDNGYLDFLGKGRYRLRRAEA